jgi:hypothetical protein
MTTALYPTENAINKLIKSLGELSPESAVHAELCRQLAMRIDGSKHSKTGAQSMALPGLVKQLGLSVNNLTGLNPVADAFLQFLMRDEEA